MNHQLIFTARSLVLTTTTTKFDIRAQRSEGNATRDKCFHQGRENKAQRGFSPRGRSQQAETSRSPSIRGLLGRFLRCCWTSRLPGSQARWEQCSTGRRQDGMVCEGRTWQQLDGCHPHRRIDLSVGPRSYLKAKKVPNQYDLWRGSCLR